MSTDQKMSIEGGATQDVQVTEVEGGKRHRLCGRGKRMSRAKKGSKNYRKCVHSKKSPTSDHMRRHYSKRRRASPRAYKRKE